MYARRAKNLVRPTNESRAEQGIVQTTHDWQIRTIGACEMISGWQEIQAIALRLAHVHDGLNLRGLSV